LSEGTIVLMGRSLIILIAMSFISFSAFSEDIGPIQHSLLRRITVFPIQVDRSFSKPAEEAWWQIREYLTENRRFLVASKNFLIQKDVFQAREELSPADAIILGKLLDAQGLVVTYLKGKTLYMKVYEGDYGRLLWHHELKLEPSVPIARQILIASKKLIMDFIASIPYQGFVVVDHLIGKAVYSEGNKHLTKVNMGDKSSVEVGDQVQFVRVVSNNLRPLFIDGAVSEVFAEGRVVTLGRSTAIVEILRAINLKDVKELSLVRFPREFKRLQENYALRSGLSASSVSNVLTSQMTLVDKEIAEKKPLVTSLAFIINLAVWLVLAF